MENKTQNQPNNKGNASKSKKYDVFISYRRLTTKDEKYSRHSSCLARSMAQTLQLEGYRVYCDCLEDTDWKIAINKSKSYIVLCAGYSFDKAIKGGENFEEEIRIITKRIEDKNDKITKNDVLFVNVENWVSKTTINENIRNIAQRDIEINVKDILTDNYSIDDLIKSKKEGKKIITKRFPRRFSYKTCRIISWFLVFVFSFLVFTVIKLNQYSKSSIIFAGGGTVQQYLDTVYHISVDNYKPNPASKYVHIPSSIAWHLLWDYINGNGEPCPVVLSTGKIDVNKDDSLRFVNKKYRIAEYYLDDIPLVVHIVGRNGTDTITLDKLKKLLMEAKIHRDKYEIWTTTEESGTYLEYKNLLDDPHGANLDTLYNKILLDAEGTILAKSATATIDSNYLIFKEHLKEILYPGFSLDDIVNNQEGGRHVFTPNTFDKKDSITQIILANKHYYYKEDDDNVTTLQLTVVSDSIDKATKTLPLYVYAIAKEKDLSVELEILPEARMFFERIECNTTVKRTTNSNRLVVEWPHK